ncbi:MAG: hypothetical protein ACK4P5_08650, partial [Fimbriimonadales bacterium]
MLWLAQVFISVGVVAFGRIAVRASAPIGRLTRRLRRLLWFSILAKVAIGVLLYPQGASVAALALLMSVGQTLAEFGLIFRWLYPIERAERDLPASAREYLIARLGMVWDALAPIVAFGLGALTLDYLLSGQYSVAGVWGALKGSFLTVIVTLMISFPIGVLTAIYLEEFAARNRWTDIVEVSINNLAAVPSIIFGLLGLAVFLNT